MTSVNEAQVLAELSRILLSWSRVDTVPATFARILLTGNLTALIMQNLQRAAVLEFEIAMLSISPSLRMG